MTDLRKRLDRIEARIGAKDDGPEMTVSGIVYWMETHKQANGGTLSPADEARANDCWRRLVANARPMTPRANR